MRNGQFDSSFSVTHLHEYIYITARAYMTKYMEMEIVGVLVIFCIFVFVFLKFRNRNSVLQTWPVVGMLPSVQINASRIHDFVADKLIETGGTLEFKGPWFANMDYLVTCDPNNIHYILTENSDNFPKGSEFKEIFDPLGDGIFNADQKLWKMQRRMIQSSLKKDNVLHFINDSVKEKVVHGLVPILHLASKEGMEIDLQQVFQQFTFENICSMVLGKDPSVLSDKSLAGKYQKAFDKMEEAMLFRNISPRCFWKLQKWLHVGIEKQLHEATKTLDLFLYECISSQKEELKRAREQGECAGIAMLAAFVDQHHENGEGKHVEDDDNSRTFLRDVALNLMLAGRDTVSSCLTWFFWLIATHPSVETKILQEIQSKMKAMDDDNKESSLSLSLWFFSACKIEELVYLQASLSETLRLYPPVPFNRKNAIVPDRLPSGHVVNKSDIILSIYSMARMKSIWGEDCLEFKPERWISSQGRIIHMSSNKFASFNAGPRTCLGKGLSFTQMKMVAAFILWNYNIKMVEGHPVLPCSSVLLHMKHGLKVTVSKRRNNGKI